MRIGPIELPAPFCQAGLAGYSDRAMRLVARRRGCPYAVTEALLDTILLAGGLGLKKSIDINDEDHPTAGQVIGSEPATVAPAAALLHDHGYDTIDLNFACPVKKIKNKARGGHMLRDLPRGVAILRAVRDRLPSATLTVSLRRSFADAETHDTLYGLLDEAFALGYAAARVHARSVEAKYFGRADWHALAEIKRHYPNRTILGSGDVFTAEDAVRMKRETNVDIVWIARGAIGNPWIFRDAGVLWREERRVGGAASREEIDSSGPYLSRFVDTPTQRLPPPTIAEQRDALAEHWQESLCVHGEQVTGRRMRKQGIKYARFHPNAVEVKREFVNVAYVADWARVLDRWYADDGPGVWPAADAADEVNDAAGCGIAE